MPGDGRAMPSILSKLPSTHSKLDRAESRQDLRRMIPIFEVLVECELFRSIDWSMGGVQLDGVCEGEIVSRAGSGQGAHFEVQGTFGRKRLTVEAIAGFEFGIVSRYGDSHGSLSAKAGRQREFQVRDNIQGTAESD